MRYRLGSLCRRRRRAREIAFAVKSGTVHCAMAVHAPAHAQILHLPDALHGFDRPMTLLAGDSRIHMWAMVEVDKVREIVDLDPLNRLWLLGRVGLHLIVESQGIVNSLNFRGNHPSCLSSFFLRCSILGANGTQRC